MRRHLTYHWPLTFLLVVLTSILFITLRPYNWNPSALLHIDKVTTIQHGVEKNIVVLESGYDGGQYYSIARQMSEVFLPDRWLGIAAHSTTIAYSYQRFLLPFSAYVLAFGDKALLPYAFLLIELASLFGLFAIIAKWYPHKSLYALVLPLTPAALIGLHFSLTEPLSLVLLTGFLVRFINYRRLKTFDAVLLALFVLCREVNILFVVFLFLYLLFKKRRRDCALLVIPIVSFLTLHTLIYVIFHSMPFFWSTDKHALPLTAIFDVLRGAHGYNAYTLSAIALFLGFVVPGICWSLWNLAKKKMDMFLPLFSLLFLGVMLCMPDHIWGSITSIGRVITPVYPLVVLQAMERDTWPARLICVALVLLGLAIGIALALIPHPFQIS